MLTPKQPDSHSRSGAWDERLRSLSLPAVIWNLAWERVSGVIVLHRRETRRHVYLHEGAPYLARSNAPREALARFLVDRDLVDRARLDGKDAIAIEDPLELVKVLHEKKASRPEALELAVAEHVREVLLAACRQTGLEKAFIGVAPEVPQVLRALPGRFDALALVRDGVEAMDLEEKAAALQGWRGPVVRTRLYPQLVRQIALTAEEQRVLEAIDGKARIGELAARLGLELPRVVGILYLASVLGLARDRDAAEPEVKDAARPVPRGPEAQSPPPSAARDLTLDLHLRPQAAPAPASVTEAVTERAVAAALAQDGYEITRLIGRGGWGLVYEARQERLQRSVAVKVLAPREPDPAAVQRFLREARSVAKLNHPNIVALYDAQEKGGVSYIVMELVEGTSLLDLVANGQPMAEPEALRVTVELAHALEHAHGRGIRHRDIKPANVFMSADGRIKLGDWGLAKSLGPTDANVTEMGIAMGTPQYMAPELLRGAKDADHRTDLYALGGTLYFMLTGRAPFQGPTIADLVAAQLVDPPPDPRLIVPAVSEATAALVTRALAKDPGARHADAADLARAADGALRGLYEDQIKRSSLVAMVQDFAVAANQAVDVPQLARVALECVCRHTQWPAGHAWLAGPAPASLWHLADARYETVRAAVDGAGAAAGGLVGRVMAHREPRWIPDVARDADLRFADPSVRIGAAVALPVVAGDEVAAVLSFYSTRPAEPDDALVAALLSVSSLLARVVERTRSEERLRQSALDYRALFEGTQDAIVVVSAAGAIVDANGRACRMYGYGRDEIIGRSFATLFAASPGAATGETQTLRPGGESRLRAVQRRKDGGEIDVEVSMSSVDFKGQRCMLIISRDVTDRVRAERAEELVRLNIQRAADEWRTTLDAIDAAVAIVDDKLRVQRLNRVALTSLLLDEYEGAIDKDILQIGKGEPWASMARLAREVIARGMAVADEVDGGAGRHFNVSASPMARPEGAMWVVLSAQDVSHMAEMREAARTGQHLAEIGGLVSTISHDMKGSLHELGLALDVIEEGTAPDAARRMAGVSRALVGQMNDLVADLLDYGRTPDVSLPDPVALADIVSEAMERCAAAAARAGVTLSVAGSPPSGPSRMHRTRMVRALVNLLHNAIQFSPEGGEVEVEASQVKGDGGSVALEIVVRDSGPGIPADDLPRLFDAFFTRRRGGTGLGLAIVAKVVAEHGGRVSASNRAGGGAELRVRMPRSLDMSDAAAVKHIETDTGPIAVVAETASERAAAREAKEAAREAERLREVAEQRLKQGRTGEAWSLLERAIGLARGLKDPRLEGWTLLGAGDALFAQGLWQRAASCFRTALQMLREAKDTKGEALALERLGGMDLSQGKSGEARAAFADALRVHTEAGDLSSEGRLMGKLAAAFTQTGDFEAAEAHFEAALGRLRVMRDVHQESVLLLNRAQLRLMQGRVHDAREHCQRALDLCLESGDRRQEGVARGNFSMVLAEQGELEQACTMCEQALAIDRAAGNREAEGSALGALAEIHRQRGDAARAKSCATQALAIYEELGQRRHEGAVLENLARLVASEGDGARAIDLLERSLEIRRQTDDRFGECSALCELARTWKIRGNKERAREAYQEAVERLRALKAGALLAEIEAEMRDVAPSSEKPKLLTRRFLEADLKRAIRRDELVLHYQPVISLADGKLVGLEALVRWSHPSRGMLLPGEFLPTARHSGLILELDRWVIKHACARMARLVEQHPEAAALWVSVNLSADKLADPALADEIESILLQSKVPAGRLRLEVDEGALAGCAAVIDRLHALGVHLSIDGLDAPSSEAARMALVGALKIGRALIGRIDSDGAAAESVKSIVALGRAVQSDVVATGIESIAVRDQARRLGCSFGQGNYFSRPLEAEAVDSLLV